MGWMLLAALVVLWAAFLIPSWRGSSDKSMKDFERNMDLLALEGRLLQIAVLHGSKASINLLKLLRQRLTVSGSTLRSRTVQQKEDIAKSVERSVWPLIEAGKVRPVIYARKPLTAAADAHRMLDEGKHVGKVLLVTDFGSGLPAQGASGS